MTNFVDLTDVPVIDNHCHAIEAVQPVGVDNWRALFTESPDPGMRARDVADTVFYRRLTRSLENFYGVSGEDSVLHAREGRTTAQLVGELFRDASIEAVVIDTGYPAPGNAMASADFVVASGAGYAALLRLEVEFQKLVVECANYDELISSVRELVADVRAAGFAGFKSIAAYRTGLAIERWSEGDARDAFVRARIEAGVTGSVRLGYKPLLDTLLHVAFEAAAVQELPVQFHVGYGDPDVDLRKASPLELRSILEDPAYRSMPVVLLHGCWPYFREGAYLASVYGNAYLDLSYAIPFLSIGEMMSMTRAALAVAPFGKLMYSSDGSRVPELNWISAKDGRRVIGTVLGELVSDGDLDPRQARRVGEQILRDNAHELYGFGQQVSR
ncbi:MAG TPA: amidohydrolase family protein [Galbitalea sp.]|nr:amidohydrolase family protein [Galbitalea sp.]